MKPPIYLCDGSQIANVLLLCEENGFGIEMQAFHHPAAINDEATLASHLKAIANIEQRSIHAPFGDLCPGSFDPMVREVARIRFDRALTVAESLGAHRIVLHHGYVTGTSGYAGWIRRSTGFWRAFVQSRASNVHLHLENMLERGPSLMVDVIDSIDSERVDVALDIGHAHCHSDVPVTEWVRALGHRIGYVHLHDNWGREDEHLGLGEGSIPLAEACAALIEAAPGAIWAIEAEGPGVEASIEWIREAGYL